MNSLFLLLALSGGRNMNPAVLKAFQTQRRENFNRWFTVIDMVVALILQYIFISRGEPTTVDAATGLPVYNTEAAIKLIQGAGLEGKKHLAWTVGVAKVMDTIKALFAPSAQEDALLEMLGGGGGGLGGMPQTVVVQGPPQVPFAPMPYPMPQGPVYRPPMGGPVRVAPPVFRAQGVYVDPNGGTYIE